MREEYDMEKLVWNETLSVGIALIDEQHKTWIDRFNAVSAAIAENGAPREIATTLGFLIDYTHFHFATEEKHMTAHTYPGLAEHLQKHDELRGTLADLVRDFEEEGPTQMLADSVNAFLGNWLIKHIQQIDHKFGVFVREQGIVITEQG
jgi:hemerythrin